MLRVQLNDIQMMSKMYKDRVLVQGFEVKNNHVEIRFITFFLKYNVFFIYIIHMLEK